MGDITDDQRKMLATYFEQCVVSASGGKKLSPDEKKNATGKAIMKMIEPLMGKSDAAFCEGGVVTKLSDKKTKKMHIDVFTNEFFPALAEYAATNIAAHKKKGTKAEDLKNKYLAAVEKELSKEKKAASNAGVVDRLTDTSKYTGSHKERFNEDGSGKGASGRKEEVKNTGYVGNYKNEGTYDAKK